MRHIFALPAVLRASLLLASASQHTFSVHDDLLAFPQFEVSYVEEYLTEVDAQARLNRHVDLNSDKQSENKTPHSDVGQYQGQEDEDGKKKEAHEHTYEYMILDGQRYLCSIPSVPSSFSSDRTANTNDTLSKVEEEKELSRATDRGWELLSSMEGSCIYFISGWWSYRFCYGQGVKQFHQLPPGRGVPMYPPVEDPGVEGYELGNYGAEKTKWKEAAETDDESAHAVGGGGWSRESALDVSEGEKKRHSISGYGELVQRGESRYLVQRLSGGTKCDLTGKERKIEVQFHCNPQSADKISLIKETSTCAYLMVIQTPRLCNDVAFLPPQKDQAHAISCSPILADIDDIETYERNLQAIKSLEQDLKVAAAAAKEKAAAASPHAPPPPTIQIVGDIVVGGHSIVPEDVTLEKSAIVGGGKETFIETLMSSDGGKLLSVEDLKKLGVGDPKVLDELKKKMEEMAKGQSWKLDIIDTPHGREYRGIVGDGDEEEEGEGGEVATKKKGKEGGKGKANDGSEEEYYKEDL